MPSDAVLLNAPVDPVAWMHVRLPAMPHEGRSITYEHAGRVNRPMAYHHLVQA